MRWLASRRIVLQGSCRLSVAGCQFSVAGLPFPNSVIPTEDFSPSGGTCCPCAASQLCFRRISDQSLSMGAGGDRAREEGGSHRTPESDVGRLGFRVGKTGAVGISGSCRRHGQQVPPLGLKSSVGMTLSNQSRLANQARLADRSRLATDPVLHKRSQFSKGYPPLIFPCTRLGIAALLSRCLK